MRTILAAIAAVVLCAACLPGQGENQSCTQTSDCQSRMVCLGTCLGTEVHDAGLICKFECGGNGACPNNEICVDSQNPCARCEPAGYDAG
jgi:hypothetical protein